MDFKDENKNIQEENNEKVDNNDLNNEMASENNISTSNDKDTNNDYNNRIDNDRVSLFYKSRSFAYYLLSTIEIFLFFRLLFKLLGANPTSGFTGLIYSVTEILVTPFKGIFSVVIPGGTPTFIFEPSTIVAMIVYAILIIGLIRLIKISLLEER